MPPRRRLQDLTPEEIEELRREGLGPRMTLPPKPQGFRARAPQQALAANDPYSFDVGALSFDKLPESTLGPSLPTEELDVLQGYDVDPSRIRIETLRPLEAAPEPTDWLAELIANPPQTPRRPLSARAEGGATFDGEDTPQSREFVKSKGMEVTSGPTDEDLLGANRFERPATMPELDDTSVDSLIAQEGAAMDAEGRARADQRYAQAFAPPTREEALGDAGEGPSRRQGLAALFSDAFFGNGGTPALDRIAARGAQARQARAEARIGDVAAGERMQDRAAQRDHLARLLDARLGTTQRGQDLRAEQQTASLQQRQERGEQVDERIRSEGALSREAAMDRTKAGAALRADAGAPTLTPEQQAAGVAAWLSQQANVSLPKARAYVSGNRQGLSDEEIERLDANYDQWQIASPKTQQGMIGKGTAREGATPDAEASAARKKMLDPDKRLKLRTEVGDTKRSVTSAITGFQTLSKSPNALKLLVSVGNAQDPESFLNAIRKAGLSGEEQAAASDIWKLMNELLHRRSGAAVTNQEMVRVADEAGLPATGWAAVFTSPQVLHHWLGKLRETAIARRKAVQTEYEGMEDL